jgi:Ca2+/H+ antiporter
VLYSLHSLHSCIDCLDVYRLYSHALFYGRLYSLCLCVLYSLYSYGSRLCYYGYVVHIASIALYISSQFFFLRAQNYHKTENKEHIFIHHINSVTASPFETRYKANHFIYT